MYRTKKGFFTFFFIFFFYSFKLVLENYSKAEPISDNRMRSLNMNLRKRELIQIAIENEAFAKRLSEKKPTYNKEKWLEDFD